MTPPISPRINTPAFVVDRNGSNMYSVTLQGAAMGGTPPYALAETAIKMIKQASAKAGDHGGRSG